MAFIVSRTLLALAFAVVMMVVVVSASSPSDVSHSRCLFENTEHTESGTRLWLMNQCSCDLTVQYTTYNSSGFQTSTVRTLKSELWMVAAAETLTDL